VIDGEILDDVNVGPATIIVDAYIDGATELDRDRAVADLIDGLSPTMGPARIVWERPDGTAREIVAYLQDGLTNVTLREPARSAPVRLVFKAMFPYWVPVNVTGGPVAPWLGTAIGGLIYPDAVGGIWAEFNIDNAGSAPTWPRLVWTGPFENLHWFSFTTGQGVRVTEIVPTGVDPRRRGVWLDDDYRSDILAAGSAELFPFRPGWNRCGIHVAKVGGANFSVGTVQWPIFYLGC
jgi:hypothetical protein